MVHNNRGIALRTVGEALAKRGQDPLEAFGKALSDFAETERLHPGLPDTFVNRGNVHHQTGAALDKMGRDPRPSFEKAIAEFDMALGLKPDYPEVFGNRGYVELSLGKAEEARRGAGDPWFEKALASYAQSEKLDPSRWQITSARGDLLERLGRLEEAAEAYEKASATAGGKVAHLKEWLANVRTLAASPAWVRGLSKAGYRVAWGNYARARELYEKALDEAEKSGAFEDPASREYLSISFYNLACVYSLASTGRRYTKARPRPLPQNEAEQLRNKALTALAKSLEFGYREFEHMRNDSDLSPLHSLPEFETLLKTWEKK
jgi:tetratricopeptide (TPR) repeat protein